MVGNCHKHHSHSTPAHFTKGIQSRRNLLSLSFTLFLIHTHTHTVKGGAGKERSRGQKERKCGEDGKKECCDCAYTHKHTHRNTHLGRTERGFIKDETSFGSHIGRQLAAHMQTVCLCEGGSSRQTKFRVSACSSI